MSDKIIICTALCKFKYRGETYPEKFPDCPIHSDDLEEMKGLGVVKENEVGIVLEESAVELEKGPVDELAEVLNAIPMLDESDNTLWTSDNKPKVDAIQEIVGFEVSAELRDAAWSEIQKVTS